MTWIIYILSRCNVEYDTYRRYCEAVLQGYVEEIRYIFL